MTLPWKEIHLQKYGIYPVEWCSMEGMIFSTKFLISPKYIPAMIEKKNILSESFKVAGDSSY